MLKWEFIRDIRMEDPRFGAPENQIHAVAKNLKRRRNVARNVIKFHINNTKMLLYHYMGCWKTSWRILEKGLQDFELRRMSEKWQNGCVGVEQE